ncbi:protein-L-isoaspartate O-methyltransferase, partial [Candidatus Woesearchaeota archaeon]|nr:protein-L-isoaspartate O-methyltransferase [Candidatus Woesearchaeota archaeon]
MHREHLVRLWSEQGIDPRLVEAFMSVPREMFVAPDYLHQVYLDRPLPTIRGQSLSQPTTVMFMTHALEVQEGQKILEVGSGVGYQASILGKLVGEKGKVITTEIFPELVQMSRENFKKLSLSNVIIQETDGAQGIPE